MQIVIIGATGWQTDELCRAGRVRGHGVRVVPYDRLVASVGSGPAAARLRGDGADVLEADVVLARIIPGGSLEQIVYRVDALHWVEDRGIPVINTPRALERCIDKFYTTTLLLDAGLPTPPTVVCERAVDAVEAVRTFGDAVIKPLFGSLGHGMTRVSDVEIARRVAQTLELMRAVFYVQQAIEHGGRDVRVFVLGGRVLGAIERRARGDEWRTNVSRGALVEPVELSPEWEALALQAAAVTGADYAGVDLLPSADGRVFVLEVNGIPGWKGLQTATGIDVADALVDYVETTVRGRGPAGGGPVARPAQGVPS